MRLFELTAAYAALQDAEDAEAFAQALDDLGDEITVKALSVAAVIRNLDAEAEATRAEANRLYERSNAAKNRRDGLKEYLLRCLDEAGMAQVKDARFTVAVRPSPPSVDVLDMAALPERYLRYKGPEPDRSAIRGDLLAGQDVPGAELVTDRKHIVIR